MTLMVACAVTSGVLNDYYNLYANVLAHTVDYTVAPKAPLHNGNSWQEYIHPYNRVGPYLVGILLADIFRHMNSKGGKLNFWVGQAVIVGAVGVIAFLML